MPSEIAKSIDNFLPLKYLMEEFYSIPKNKYKAGVEKIQQIALLLSKVTDLLPTSPSLTGRINFVGKELLKESTRLEKKYDFDAQLLGLIIELHNYKNALQVEAVFYGSIFKVIEMYQEWSQNPILEELWATLPTIVEHIVCDYGYEKCPIFKIDLALLEGCFSSLELDKLPVSFDQIVSSMYCLYEIQDNCLIIPGDKIPSIDILGWWIESPDSYIKLLGQILLFCKFDILLFTSCAHGKFTAEAAFSCFNEKLFIHYLNTKKELIPVFTHLLKYTIAAKGDNKALSNILLNKVFLNEDKTLKGSDWLEEGANVYNLIIKLELGIKKIFPITSPSLKRLEYAVEPNFDTNIFLFTACYERLPKCTLKYPISPKNLFVLNVKDFKQLSLYYYLLANYKEESETAKKSNKDSKDKKQTKEHRSRSSKATFSTPLVSEVAATGGAGTSSFTTTIPIKEEEDFSLSSLLGLLKSKKLTPSKEEKSSSKKEVLLSSIMETQELLKKISIHKRVAIWWDSIDAALAYYEFGKDDKIHYLSKEEMILSHQLPKKLLLLLLNSHFGIKKRIILKTGEVISEHYEASITINKQRYIIEASINEKNELFHYYARQIKKVEDLKIRSNSTLDLGSTETSKDSWLSIPLTGLGFTLDEEGNVSFEEKDRTYFIPRLQHPWLAKP